MYKFQPVLELLRNKSASDFQNAFEEENISEKVINFEDFKTLLKFKLDLDVKECDAEHLFCQIDRYAKGIITSADLSEYLNQYEKKRMLPHEGPFNPTPALYPGVRCQDSVIDWILYPEIPDIRDEVAGHYVSVSRCGIINIWSRDMEKRLEVTIETSDDGGSGKSLTWATSLACFPKEKLLAVSTTSGDIRFFRSSLYKFEHRLSIVCLPHVVLRMSCSDSQRLVCGDFSGNVFMIRVEKSFFSRNRRRSALSPPEKILFEHVKMGKISDMSYHGTAKQHLSAVQKVEYIPNLCAVISCSMNTKRAMLIHFLENNESLSFQSSGGISCFAFSERLSSVITGGADHSIKIWNPTVNKRCNESLTGHSSPINHLVTIDSRLLLISSDREKNIHVWDLLHPKCLQVIHFKDSEFPGRQSFASLSFDSHIGRLILTTYKIGMIELIHKAIREKTHPYSEYITLAAFSSVYRCIVTVGNSSSIAIWDAETGILIYEFDKTHNIIDPEEIPRNMSIMTAGLDPTERRLVTADRIGVIKVWNFHLGLCLQSFNAHCTVLSLSLVGFHIYAAGSSGVIIDFYDNGAETVESAPGEDHHKKSIVSMDCYRKFLLASASCDGEILIWLRRSPDPKFRLKDLEEGTGQEMIADKDYLVKAEIEKRRRCSISQVLFLQRREMDFFVGNLVSCGMDGRIRFWNIVCTLKENQGKLLSRFRCVFRDSDGVLCLTTDAENRYLISGDTMGYIRVYELDNYYSAYGSALPKQPAPQEVSKFPFLRLQRLLDQKHPQASKFSKGDGREVGFVPFLLNCFRGHMGPVLKLGYVNEKDVLVSAGKEGSVRLWSISGVCVGRLGPDNEPWDFDVGERKMKKCHIPPDLKPCASSLSLYVMNNGDTPYWNRALKALRNCRLGNQPEGFMEKVMTWNEKKSQSTEELSEGSLEDDLAQLLPHILDTRKPTQKLSQNMIGDA